MPDVVSVIVPVCNAEQFLPAAIASVLGQSYAHLELILVNDGSTDASEQICQHYARSDTRLKVIAQPNRGPAAARNTGLRQATGTFAFFLDADDYLERHAIKTLVDAQYQSRSDLVMSNFSKLENDGTLVPQPVAFRPDDPPYTLPRKALSATDALEYLKHFLKHPSNHLMSYCWARLYRLSIITNQDLRAREDMRLFEDFVFNLDYLQHANSTVFVNESLYTYRMHNQHVSASMGMVNSERLLHDLDIFKTKTIAFFQCHRADPASVDVQKLVGHAIMHYVIIFLVRTCRQVTRHNRPRIAREINAIIRAPILQESLPCYSPSRGNSRILPVLMRLKWVSLIMLLGAHKAKKRYGKLGAIA